MSWGVDATLHVPPRSTPSEWGMDPAQGSRSDATTSLDCTIKECTMGEFVKDMYGCTIPHVMKFAIGASFANAGVLVEAPNGDDAGVTPCSTTAAADVV